MRGAGLPAVCDAADGDAGRGLAVQLPRREANAWKNAAICAVLPEMNPESAAFGSAQDEKMSKFVWID